jgi:hypothetical protein
MNKAELADRLHRLDPGATLSVEEGALAQAFDTTSLSDQVIESIEMFALENRCTFTCSVHGRITPVFVKDDIY